MNGPLTALRLLDDTLFFIDTGTDTLQRLDLNSGQRDILARGPFPNGQVGVEKNTLVWVHASEPGPVISSRFWVNPAPTECGSAREFRPVEQDRPRDHVGSLTWCWTSLIFALSVEETPGRRRKYEVFCSTVCALVTLSLCVCSSGAWALGTVITQDGTTVQASRSLIVRSADTMRLVTQIKYGAATDNLIWLVPIPNFNRPEDEGVRVEVFASSAMDELDALSRPVLNGECDGEPTGMAQEILQAESFGPGLDMRPAIGFYTAAEIEENELNEYITGQGFQVSESAADNIAQIVNQNFMFVAVRLNLADLGVARVDPIISISYPAERGSNQKIALRPLNDVTSEVSDIVLWILDTDRAQMNVTTADMEFTDVEFITGTETNYLTAFDQFVGTRQTQMFVTEFAGAVDPTGIMDETLSSAMSESGSTFLTRLHARMVPAALRASAAFVNLQTAAGAVYDRSHGGWVQLRAAMPDAGGVNALTLVNLPTAVEADPRVMAAWTATAVVPRRRRRLRSNGT